MGGDGAIEPEDGELDKAEGHAVCHTVDVPRYQRASECDFDLRSFLLKGVSTADMVNYSRGTYWSAKEAGPYFST